MLVSTSAATDVEFLARPAPRSRWRKWRRAFTSALSRRGLLEVCQAVAAQLNRLARHTPVNLYRATNRSQFQVVAHANAASLGERLRKRDLEFARHLRHDRIIASIKDSVKDSALITVGLQVLAAEKAFRRR